MQILSKFCDNITLNTLDSAT